MSSERAFSLSRTTLIRQVQRRRPRNLPQAQSLSETIRHRPKLPTQARPQGLRFDFNDGCRVVLPEARASLAGASERSRYRQYPVRDRDQSRPRQQHQSATSCAFGSKSGRRARACSTTNIRPTGRDVLVQFPVGTLGDTMGWFPYAVKFKERHGCRLTCAMSGKADPAVSAMPIPTSLSVRPTRSRSRKLLRDLQHGAVLRRQGLRAPAVRLSPSSACTAPPAIFSASIRPKRRRASRSPTTPADSPSPMSASRCKAPRRANTGTTRPAGARSSSSSRRPAIGSSASTRSRPTARPRLESHPHTAPRTRPATSRLQERARWLKHAAFFVGLSSGLSWLAWAVGTPVVMISGLHRIRPTSSRRLIG